MEGPWTKWGVVIGFGVLLITYSGTASQLHWFPFSHSHHITPPSPSPSPPSPSPPLPSPPSPSSSPPTLREGATFLAATPLGPADCQCAYQYSVRIDFVGLQGESPVVDWWTVYSASGLDAGTSGKVVTSTMLYNNDTWTDTFNVTKPIGAVTSGWQWYTDFAVYAPDGTELAKYP